MNSKLAAPIDEDQHESEGSDIHEMPPAYRRDSKSSTERSLYDEKAETPPKNLATPGHFRPYGFYHPKAMTRGVFISNRDDQTPALEVPLYYVEMSQYAVRKPDVILHQLPPMTSSTHNLEYLANTGESAPVIGIGQFSKFSRQIKVGLGDPSSNVGMTYLDVSNPNVLGHGGYEMSLGGKSYAWRRTQDPAAGVKGSAFTRALTRGSFQLFDATTNEVIAVFLAYNLKGWLKKGKLRVFKDIEGSDFDAQQLKLLIFWSIASIIEKSRGRQARRRHKIPY